MSKIASNIYNVAYVWDDEIDEIFIDTSVLYHLMSAKDEQCYKQAEYSRFFKQIKTFKCKSYVSEIVLGELFHLTEKKRLDLYNKEEDGDDIHIKDFRKIHNKREEYLRIATTFLSAIEKLTDESFPVTLSKDSRNKMLTLCREAAIDSNDAFNIEVMNNKGLTAVLTDDYDFAYVEGLKILTANRKLICDAKAAGKLANFGGKLR